MYTQCILRFPLGLILFLRLNASTICDLKDQMLIWTLICPAEPVLTLVHILSTATTILIAIHIKLNGDHL